MKIFERINSIYNKYIGIVYGYELEDKELINTIKINIGYLIDNNLSDEEALYYMFLHHGNIENDLWKDKLTKPNTFYYHSLLRITNDVPTWNPEEKEKTSKFFLEMKFNFNMDNLLNYYYSQLLVPVELRDYKRDSGALQHLLNKYNFSNWDSLDFILTLIDIANTNETQICNVFDLEKNTKDAFERLSYICDFIKTKEIIWRDYYGM